MTITFGCISYNLCAVASFANASRCINQHGKFNSFERSTNTWHSHSITYRERKSYWKGILCYFDPPWSGEESAYLVANRENAKRDRACFYSIDSPDRSCYSYVRSLHSFAFFDGAAKWNASLPRYAPQILPLFLPPTEFSPSESILSRRWNELYICLWLLWNSRGGIFAIRVRGKSCQLGMQPIESNVNKGIRFCSSNGWAVYFEESWIKHKMMNLRNTQILNAISISEPCICSVIICCVSMNNL